MGMVVELRHRKIHVRAGEQAAEMAWPHFCFVIVGASARSLIAVALNRMEKFGKFSFRHPNNGFVYTLHATEGWPEPDNSKQLLLGLDCANRRIYSTTLLKQAKANATQEAYPLYPGVKAKRDDVDLSCATIKIGDTMYVEHLANNDFAITMKLDTTPPTRWIASALKVLE